MAGVPAKHSTMNRSAYTERITQSQMSIVPRLRNPYLAYKLGKLRFLIEVF
jgi:hypothetical protein